MWKNVKFKKGALSILLILGLVLTNLSPLGSWAGNAEKDYLKEVKNVLTPAFGEKSEKISTELLEIVRNDKYEDLLSMLKKELAAEGINVAKASLNSDDENLKDKEVVDKKNAPQLENKDNEESEAVEEADNNVANTLEIPAIPNPGAAPETAEKKNFTGFNETFLKNLMTIVNSDANTDTVKATLMDLKADNVAATTVSKLVQEFELNKDDLPQGKKYKLINPTITQDGRLIGDNDTIDPNKNISFNTTIKIRIKDANNNNIVAPGNTIRIKLGKRIKYTGDSNKEIEFKDVNTGKLLATGTIGYDSAEQELYTDIKLNSDSNVFGNGNYTLLTLNLGFSVDKSALPEGETDKKVWILDNEHSLVESELNIEMKKSAKVDWDKAQIIWTVEINNKTLGSNNGLAGYQFSDDLSNVGDLVKNNDVIDFKITTVDDKEIPGLNPQPKEEGKKLTCVLPDDTPAKVKISFKTEIRTATNNSEIMNGFDGVDKEGKKLKNQKYNIARLFQKDETGAYVKPITTAEAWVDGDKYWGSKYYGNILSDRLDPKYHTNPIYTTDPVDTSNYNNGLYSEDDNNYYVDWVIVFDARGKNLTNVAILDEMPKDKRKYSQMEFVKADLSLWNAAENKWEHKKEYKQEPEGQKYLINEGILGGNTNRLNTAVKLVIKAKVPKKDVPFRVDFTNTACVIWGADSTIKVDNLWRTIEISGQTQFLRKEVVKDVKKWTPVDEKGNKRDTVYYVKADPVWELSIDNKYIVDGKTFVYDPIIYSEDITNDNLKDPGYEGFSLDSEQKKKSINETPIKDLFYNHVTHNVYVENSFNNNGHSITCTPHKLYYKGKEVGVLLEFSGFKKEEDPTGKKRQKFTIQTKLVDRNVLTFNAERNVNAAKAQVEYAGKKMLIPAYWWPLHYSKMIKKQAISSNAAVEILKNRSAIGNINIGENADNKETAYNPKEKSILYRLSVNASNYTTKGVRDKLGEIVLSDTIDKGWTFDKIDDDNEYLIYRGEVRDPVDFSGNRSKYVKAEGEPLSEGDINNIIESFKVTKEPEPDGRYKATFKFKELDSPYVILLKARITGKEAVIVNKDGEVKNTAKFSINGTATEEEECKVKYDARFLYKTAVGTPVESKLKWIVKYEPSLMSKEAYDYIKNADNVVLKDELGKGLRLVRADETTLAYGDGMYALTEITESGTTRRYTDKSELAPYLTATFSKDNGDVLALNIPKQKRNNTYILEYTTQIAANVGEIVSNKVKLEADKKNYGETSASFNYVDGSGSGITGTDKTLIQIKKVDEKGNPLTGASFSLQKKGSSAVEKTVGNDGTVTFENLLAGKYVLKETKAPSDYIQDTTEHSFEIVKLYGNQGFMVSGLSDKSNKVTVEGSNTICFVNSKQEEKRFDLKLIKADLSDNNATTVSAIKTKLNGAKFILTYPDNSIKSDVTVDGILKFEGLKGGVYKLKEEAAPTDYELLTSEYEITVTPSAVSGEKIAIKNEKGNEIKLLEDKETVVVFNKKKDKLYNLVLFKADLAESNVNTLDGFTSKLADAKFSLTATPGAAVAVNQTTGADGTLTFTGLKKGKYILKEEKAPEGYALVKDTYEVTINPDAAEGDRVIIKSADNQIKKIGDTVVFFNEKLYDLEIRKADLVDKSATELNNLTTLLNGAKFTLVKEVKQGETAQTPTLKVTGKDGSTNGAVVFKGLRQGTYILTETEAPTGYAILANPYEITVTPSAVKSEVAIKEANHNQIKQIGNTIVVFNEKVLDLKLIKASLTDKDATSAGAVKTRLSGAKFKLVSDKDVIYTGESDGIGEVIFKGLKTGTYTLTETEAPNSFNSLIKSYEIVVTASAVESKVAVKEANEDQIKMLEAGEIVVFNEQKANSFNLKLVKADLSDKNATTEDDIKYRLNGAEFRLSLKSTPDVVSMTAITTTGGILTFYGLDGGVYTLKETKAPEGYASLIDEYEITVTPSAVSGTRVAIKGADENQIKRIGDTIVVFNEKLYDLNLLKADLDVNIEVVTKSGVTLGAIKTPLNGAKFRLALESNPAVSYSAVTGDKDKVASDGSIVFKGLKSGTYVLTEEAAPSGYNLVKNSYTIVVTASAVKSELDIKEPKAGEIREVKGTVVVFNKKTPYVPYPIPDPDPTPGPSPSPDPSPNPNPDPNPNPPTPTTDLPRYPENDFPDPNDPGSPDEFVAVDDEGTPQGKYVKSKKPDGTNEYIPVDEDGIPLGVNKAKKKLPKTGGSDTTVYYVGGAMLLLLAGAVVVRRKKYNK